MQAGFSDTQAETVTDVVREARERDISELATKADLAAVNTDLKTDVAAIRADLAAVKAELKADLAGLESRVDIKLADLRTALFEVKADLLKWVIGLILVQGGVVVALIKLLPGGH